MNRSKKIPDSLKVMAHKENSKIRTENSFLDLLVNVPSIKKEEMTMVKAVIAKS